MIKLKQVLRVCWIAFLVRSAITLRDSLEAEGSMQEVCQWDTFVANCSRSEVVIIQSAMWGRMNIGRCLKADYGFLGCAADVAPYLDYRCSGRRACSVAMHEQVLRQVQPCREDFAVHLKASYTCLPVTPPDYRQCHTELRQKVASQTAGYLAAADGAGPSPEDPACPWLIEMAHGQQVNLTLFNFARGGKFGENHARSRHGHAADSVCHEVAQVHEASGSLKRITVCDSTPEESHVYMSTTNTITVKFTTAQPERGAFLIKYEAAGCVTPPVPEGGTLDHVGRDVVVRCPDPETSYYLECVGTAWTGSVRNCSQDSGSSLLFRGDGAFPYGILLVVAIGVALGVFCGGLLLSAMVVIMRRRSNTTEHNIPPQHESHYTAEDKYTTFDPRAHQRLAPPLDAHALPPPMPLEGVMTSRDVVCHSHDWQIMSGPPSPKSCFQLPTRCDSLPNATLKRSQQIAGRAGPDLRHIYECPKYA